jgi:hypothetical protein
MTSPSRKSALISTNVGLYRSKWICYPPVNAVLVVLFVPSVERDGTTPIEQETWVEASLETFGRIFGGATAYRKLEVSGATTSGTGNSCSMNGRCALLHGP